MRELQKSIFSFLFNFFKLKIGFEKTNTKRVKMRQIWIFVVFASMPIFVANVGGDNGKKGA